MAQKRKKKQMTIALSASHADLSRSVLRIITLAGNELDLEFGIFGTIPFETPAD